jgi:uncharacterized Zn finger protein
MVVSTKCDKCGDLMMDNVINRQYCLESTQHHCDKCGYFYESGFRYNILIKQFVKYVRFN